MSNLYKIAEDGNYKLKVVYDLEPENPREWDNMGNMICFHNRYNLGDKHSYNSLAEFLMDLITDDSSLYEHPIIEEKLSEKMKNISIKRSIDSYYVVERIDNEKHIVSEGLTLTMVDKIISELEDEYLDEILEVDTTPLTISEMLEIVEDTAIMLPLHFYDHSIQSISTSSFSGRALHADWDSGIVGYIYCTFEDVKGEFNVDVLTSDLIEEVKNILKGEVRYYDDYIRGEVFGYEIIKKIKCELCGHEDEEMVDNCYSYYGTRNLKESLKDDINKEYHFLIDML